MYILSSLSAERLRCTTCAEAVEQTQGNEDKRVENFNNHLPPDLNPNQTKRPLRRLAFVFCARVEYIWILSK